MKLLLTALRQELNCPQLECVKVLSDSITHENLLCQDGETRFFVKKSTPERLKFLQAEAAGLDWLRKTNTVRVPIVYACGSDEHNSYLVTEYIDLFPLHFETKLGEQLAQLHLLPISDLYGFEVDTVLGATVQPNTWAEDWVPFFRDYRLKFQIDLTKDKEIMDLGHQVLEKLPSLFQGVDLRPSLIHGDLWIGNAACDSKGHPVVYDPACYFAHHEAEFGIMRMFGGFGVGTYEAYHAFIPARPGYEERSLVYQLYHQLNHYNIFGEGYRSGCIELMQKILLV